MIAVKESFSEERLTAISAGLISAYREKKRSFFSRFIAALFPAEDLRTEPLHRAFAKIIRLYHPDRAAWYAAKIDQCSAEGDSQELKRLSHIISVPNQHDPQRDREGKPWDDMGRAEENTDHNEEWSGPDGWETIIEENIQGSDTIWMDRHDVYSAVRHLEFGNLDVPLPIESLEELEGELDLSGYGIDDLTGIEYCVNVTSLDLSGNDIDDISLLQELDLLEELFLAGNLITTIHALRSMKSLRVLDLSANEIRDLSPLFDLPALEYLNVMDNPVNPDHIAKLSQRGITVVI